MPLPSLTNLLRRNVWARTFRVWHHAGYRLPMTGLESRQGIEPRRADLVRWYALEHGVLTRDHFRAPEPASYEALARVHSAAYLESLSQPGTLARIFAADESSFPVDEAMHTTRLGVGGTLAATAHALDHHTHALNLLGGFHHAFPEKGGGLCAANDIAVAVADLRHRGWQGQVGVLDLDAHPPDGLAACLEKDPKAWIGSISGSDWGPMPRVDEVLLPEHSGNRVYLDALESLLDRMPKLDLAYVIAGGDVLARDRMGRLGMTLGGAQRRDMRVFRELEHTPTVWVPGGGYHSSAWRVLAGTMRVLALHSNTGVPKEYDPLGSHFAFISSRMETDRLQGDAWFSQEEVDEMFGAPPAKNRRFMGYYTLEGVEYALFRLGLLTQLRRLGYAKIRVGIDTTGSGDRLRVWGTHAGVEHLLVENVLARAQVQGRPVLFIHWLELSHPMSTFAPGRPQLPGQKSPGLGLAREAEEIQVNIARRLGLDGVMLRPAWFHVAYGVRKHFQFVDPPRQGRFLALLRDAESWGVAQTSQAVADGRVLLNGQRYVWEADEMVHWLDGPVDVGAETQAEMDRAHFSLA